VSAEENKALARRLVEAQSTGDLEVLGEVLASDFVDRSLLPGQEPDREGFKRSVAEMAAPFSHQRVTIEDQIAEGDKVLTRATSYAVHDQGEFLGMPPTGEEWVFTTMLVHRIVGGRITEEWSESNIDPWLNRHRGSDGVGG
jgi:predicted ester cyclase